MRWKQAPRVPRSYPSVADANARYLLRMVKSSLIKIHDEQERELGLTGYDAVPTMVERDGRSICDPCKTAIADMYYGCTDVGCRAEFCLKCVAKVRSKKLKDVLIDAPDELGPSFVMPKMAFDEDSVETLGSFGMHEATKLQFLPELAELPCSQAVYVSALAKHLGGFKQNALHCPGFRHRDMRVEATPERPLDQAVLLLRRRLPRTFIPRLLTHPEVEPLPSEALPPRLHFGSIEPPPEARPCMWCARIAAATVPDANGVLDLRSNPNLRRASYRGQADDWLWTPAFDDVDPAKIGGVRYLDACAHFQWHWRRRQFPVVRNIKSVRRPRCRGMCPSMRPDICARLALQRLDWGPGTMRVLLERAARVQGETDMEVLICRTGHPAACPPKEFIDGYGNLMLEPMFGKSQPGDMLKLKDWPPKNSFAEAVPRQYGASSLLSVLFRCAGSDALRPQPTSSASCRSRSTPTWAAARSTWRPRCPRAPCRPTLAPRRTWRTAASRSWAWRTPSRACTRTCPTPSTC